MAIVWANASGNWSNTTIWKFYNETSGQIEDYGQVPQLNDIVYLNGFNVNLISGTGNGINLGSNGWVRNDENQQYNIASGGCLLHSQSGVAWFFINANLYCSGGYLISCTGSNNSDIIEINGNIEAFSNFAYSTHYEKFYINGNITLHSCHLLKTNANGWRGFECNGNITLDGSGCAIALDKTISYGSESVVVNGDITSTDPTNKLFNIPNTANLYYSGIANNVILGTNVNQLSLSGEYNTQDKIFSNIITTLNLNGTINTSAPLATNITTLNLNGTINTSNDTIADFPITTTNIQEGSHITYSQQQPLGWGELNAPADFEFEYAGSGVSTGAYIIVNKNEFQHSYPPENYVVSGTTYGDSNQFTGTMTQPLESVVLKDYVYASGTKTGTLDTSNLNVPSDLTQQFDDIETRLTVLNSRLSQADIIAALEQYQAVKTSDLANVATEPYIAAILGENNSNN